MEHPTVVSLFAGIGGICLGFKKAGFDIIWANEKDPAACKTYRHNLGDAYLVEGDIRKVDIDTIPHADVLAAGFPCQSFSLGGLQKGFADPRGTLFFEVIKVAERIKPPVIFLENVENLMDHDSGRTFQIIFLSLAQLGYIVRYRPMPTHEYSGIPQTRRRIYIVAFLDEEKSRNFHFPDPVRLTKLGIEWINTKEKAPAVYYYTGANKFEESVREMVTDRSCFYRIFNGGVTKMNNRKCSTVTASMTTKRNAIVLRDDFGVRSITVDEALSFQGFPENYSFPPDTSIAAAMKQIGNSVTVPVVERIAKKISEVL